MLSFFHTQEKQIFLGNALFVICCGFYLAWWLLAFKPTGAITGMKSGWLLIPACITGLLGVILAIRGIFLETPTEQLLPNRYILLGGIAVYIILLVITALPFKRPVTSELLLIVGWGTLAFAEVNLLFGIGLFSHRLSIGFLVFIGSTIAISLVCYILYYRLDSRAGYIDGMVPLLLAAFVMAVILCFMLISNK